MKFWTLALALVLTLGGVNAEAKRLGGGKSVGKQSSNVSQREAAPAAPAQSAAVPAKPAAAPAAPAHPIGHHAQQAPGHPGVGQQAELVLLVVPVAAIEAGGR